MTSISASNKSGSVDIRVDATYTKKAQCATVLVKFPGDKSVLLSKLLQLFAHEKAIPGFMPITSFVFSAIAGDNAILLTCPDAKVLYAVLALYVYLHKMKIGGVHLKQVNTSSDTFKKLFDRLSRFELVIVGKCKSTALAIGSKAKKWTQFCKACGAAHDKFKDKIRKDEGSDKSQSLYAKTFTISKRPSDQELFNLYLSIILGNTACRVRTSANNIVIELLNQCDTQWATVFKSSWQTAIKGFLGQYGAVGNKPDDATAAKKWKAKVDDIITSLNAASQVICGVRGLAPFRFTNAESAKNIDKDILNLLKAMKEA